MKEGTSLRPFFFFLPVLMQDSKCQPSIFKMIMRAMQYINSYLVKPLVKKKKKVPTLSAVIYSVLAKILHVLLAVPVVFFSDLSILFPETLLYLVKNSPRLNLSNLPLS